ncbi:PTS sugar transporter subunit IIA [Peribacillus muralis]|uniref:PTS sugar transporter subunit IIA n=1 Tax=Peribacillus muralis TaxID=264697 RepID=UPI00366C25B7
MNRAILLVSHGNLASTMKECVQLITGKQKDLYALSMDAEETFDSFSSRLETSVNQLRVRYQEIIILADIKGGSPCNAATLQVLKERSIQVIAGFHLGLVIECCLSPASPRELIANASQSISHINSVIN